MATIQADLTMLPERFDLTYIDEHGQPQRPIAIHRAIYGSLERFIGILVEHFGGRVPALGRAGPGRRHPDRRPPRRRRPASSPASSREPRPAGRGRRLGQPDAEQDPARPGAEGAVHARPRRPRGRGADGRPPRDARGRAAAGRGLGRAGGPAGAESEVRRAQRRSSVRIRARPRGRTIARVSEALCYPPACDLARAAACAPCRASSRDRARTKGSTISRDLRVNQMIRIPQVRVVDEEGAQLGVMPTPQALAMAQERGLDLVEVAPMAVAAGGQVPRLRAVQVRADEAGEGGQAQAALGDLQGGPPQAEDRHGRLRHEGPSGDRVPRGGGPDQGRRPVPGSGADPPGDRPGPPRRGSREQIKDHGVVERAPLLEGKSMHITVASVHKPKVTSTPTRHGHGPTRREPRTTAARLRPLRPSAPAERLRSTAPAAAGPAQRRAPAAATQPANAGRRPSRVPAAVAGSSGSSGGGARGDGTRPAEPAAGTEARTAKPAPSATPDHARRPRPEAPAPAPQESETSVPKIKSHKAAQKRIGVTGSGKVYPRQRLARPSPRDQVVAADPPLRRQDRSSARARRAGPPPAAVPQ